MRNNGLRDTIRQTLWLSERTCVQQRLHQARLDSSQEQAIQLQARDLVVSARKQRDQQPDLDAFLHEYDLSSREGILLMCLAEALLRIPDTGTADRLIRDRLAKGQWDAHLGNSSSLLVNASSWGLLLTGQLLTPATTSSISAEELLRRFVARAGEPLARMALQQAMQLLARQFVLGRDMNEALQRSDTQATVQRYSYDCLGEAAHTAAEVERYFHAYKSAILQLAATVQGSDSWFEQPGISIKLSALHPRYEYMQRRRVYSELVPRLEQLLTVAADAGITVTLDAEEASRLELSLDIFSELLECRQLSGWNGLGLAVQAYQKRAYPVLQWLRQQAVQHSRVIPVRLVKGAYWDSEIKRAQESGLAAYPVFTRKAATDVSYLACVGYLLEHNDCFFPQFASHNAFTLAWVIALAKGRNFELQRLHGMGEALYSVLDACYANVPPVRIYAPVGDHEALLPYLVRRLLENGANSSFVNQLLDEDASIESLVANPCDQIEAVAAEPHPRIPLPIDMYGEQRANSKGRDLSDPATVAALQEQVGLPSESDWQGVTLIGGEEFKIEIRPVCSPADRSISVGQIAEADAEHVELALASAALAAPAWDAVGGEPRAKCLRNAADMFETHADELIARIVHEGARTIPDALAELREAVDFCRYYAVQAEAEFSRPLVLPGPVGERNELALHGRGVFACISPWNFPLAIFVGQITAALAAGNTVIAKPARQTPLTGYRAVQLLHQAGVPGDVLHFLPGSGQALGARLCADLRLAGVAFTGSTETAWSIQRALAARRGPIVPLIAETGGQNVMIADSSALLEQLVVDVLQSAFNSAGQRCSALRVLFVQDDIADAFIHLLCGAMEELNIGDPAVFETDIGPLISDAAVEELGVHQQRMQREARQVYALKLLERHRRGSFFAPCVYELDALSQLEREVFGPVLHLIRYSAGHLDAVIDAVNQTGYGLTLGVHSRIESTWQQVSARARVGNLYINRNMIGAVVGAQPFGGEGLSGTGPKAGGPYYLHRFATERTRSVNTAALGGDAGLLSLSDD